MFYLYFIYFAFHFAKVKYCRFFVNNYEVFKEETT